MNLKQINEITDHRITEGSDYGWNCYPNARYLSYESEFAYVSVLYSTKTQEIYEADATIKEANWFDEDKNMRPYRWLNPEFKDSMIAEAKSRKVKWKKAWDEVKWVDLETEEDFLEKAEAMFNGKEFDKRVQVPIDLEDDVMLKLCMEAHKRDITLNQMVEEILKKVIEEHEPKEVMDE
jgi:predicted HicB family RNase H-like nuclease